jgi:hypothetical protein
MSLLPVRRVRWAALGAIVGGFVVGGIAWADIPDSGVINGCYKTSGGALRVIDSSTGETCKPSESPLSWSQSGPKGATGVKGPTGAKGETGAKGPTGASGGLRAWARVDENGTIINGQNILAVQHDPSDPGLYCVFANGVDASKAAAIGTPDSGAHFGLNITPNLCPGGNGFLVSIWDASTGNARDNNFSIAIP